MTRTRRAILDLLAEKAMSFDEIYSKLKKKGVVGKEGINQWNVAKSLAALNWQAYIYTLSEDKGKLYCLDIDGKVYLKQAKIMEDL